MGIRRLLAFVQRAGAVAGTPRRGPFGMPVVRAARTFSIVARVPTIKLRCRPLATGVTRSAPMAAGLAPSGRPGAVVRRRRAASRGTTLAKGSLVRLGVSLRMDGAVRAEVFVLRGLLRSGVIAVEGSAVVLTTTTLPGCLGAVVTLALVAGASRNEGRSLMLGASQGLAHRLGPIIVDVYAAVATPCMRSTRLMARVVS